jgi:protein phosphatase
VIAVNFGAATSAGRVRELNEDDFVAEPPVFAVADGMGGHAAGEVASGIAVGKLRDLACHRSLQPADVAAALTDANEQVLFKSGLDNERAGMGTTAAGLVAVDAGGVDHWLVFNVGDSRVYRFAGGSLLQLTTDHSEVQELVSAGQITAQQARTHPRRNIVTRALGSTPGPTADQWLLPPSLGERFLLCSDGLSGELTDDEIADQLRGGAPAQDVADALVSLAVAAGGRDNVTVVVVDVTGTTDDDADRDTAQKGLV